MQNQIQKRFQHKNTVEKHRSGQGASWRRGEKANVSGKLKTRNKEQGTWNLDLAQRVVKSVG